MLKYAFALHEDSPLGIPLEFHKFIHISSSTYVFDHPENINLVYEFLLYTPFLLFFLKDIRFDPIMKSGVESHRILWMLTS